MPHHVHSFQGLSDLWYANADVTCLPSRVQSCTGRGDRLYTSTDQLPACRVTFTAVQSVVIGDTQTERLPACRVAFTSVQGLVIGDNCTQAQMLPTCRVVFTAVQGLAISDTQAQNLPACRVTFTVVKGMTRSADVTCMPRPVHSCTRRSDRLYTSADVTCMPRRVYSCKNRAGWSVIYKRRCYLHAASLSYLSRAWWSVIYKRRCYLHAASRSQLSRARWQVLFRLMSSWSLCVGCRGPATHPVISTTNFNLILSNRKELKILITQKISLSTICNVEQNYRELMRLTCQNSQRVTVEA